MKRDAVEAGKKKVRVRNLTIRLSTDDYDTLVARAEEAGMTQYEIWWAHLPDPVGRRPVLLLSRSSAYQVLNKFIVAEITTRLRGIPQEVRLGPRPPAGGVGARRQGSDQGKFDLFGERQTTNCNCFGPASVSHHQLTVKRLLYHCIKIGNGTDVVAMWQISG